MTENDAIAIVIGILAVLRAWALWLDYRRRTASLRARKGTGS